MSFIRTKEINGNNYLYLVKNKREGGTVKQEVIQYIGPAGSTAPKDIKDEYRKNLGEDQLDKLGTTQEDKENEMDKKAEKLAKIGVELKQAKETNNKDKIFKLKKKKKQIKNNLKDDWSKKEYREKRRKLSKKVSTKKKDYKREKSTVDWDNVSVIKMGDSYKIDNLKTGHNIDSAEKIQKTTDNAIKYKEEGKDQKHLISKKNGEIKTYKVYNYKDGDAVFINDEKTKVKEIID